MKTAKHGHIVEINETSDVGPQKMYQAYVHYSYEARLSLSGHTSNVRKNRQIPLCLDDTDPSHGYPASACNLDDGGTFDADVVSP